MPTIANVNMDLSWSCCPRWPKQVVMCRSCCHYHAKLHQGKHGFIGTSPLIGYPS